MVDLFFLVSLWRGRGRYVSILRPTQIGCGAVANRTTTGGPRAHAEQQGGFAEDIGLLCARVAYKSLPFDLCKAVKQQRHKLICVAYIMYYARRLFLALKWPFKYRAA